MTFNEMIIDSSLKMTPCRTTATSKLVHPDHYAMLVKFENVPMKTKVVKNGVREVIWNTHKVGGWERYHAETDVNRKLESVMLLKEDDVESKVKIINKELTRIKHKVFGKVSLNKKPKSTNPVNAIQNRKLSNESSEDSESVKVNVDSTNV